jgi:hypothetical protein
MLISGLNHVTWGTIWFHAFFEYSLWEWISSCYTCESLACVFCDRWQQTLDNTRHYRAGFPLAGPTARTRNVRSKCKEKYDNGPKWGQIVTYCICFWCTGTNRQVYLMYLFFTRAFLKINSSEIPKLQCKRKLCFRNVFFFQKSKWNTNSFIIIYRI